MKVLHLSSEGPWRGGEQQIAYLISELKQRGVVNHVATKENSAFEQWCDKNNVPYTSMPFRNSIDIRSSLYLRKLITTFAPDIIHIHSSKSHGIIGITALLMNLRTPLVLSRRVCFPIKNGFLNTRKYFLKSLKKIICVSNDVKKTVEKLKGTSDKTMIIYDGIDIEKYASGQKSYIRKQFQLPENAVLVGNTSALTEEKDYITFIDVAEKINSQEDQEVHFFVIGKGPMQEQLRSYAKSKTHGSKIHFTGFVNNVEDYLSGLDVFLFTSLQEGLGTSVLNAFATHIPVITTNVGGLPELVDHEHTGLLVNPQDSDMITSQLRRLLEDDELRNNIAKRAYESLDKFTYQRMTDETYKVYEQILIEKQ